MELSSNLNNENMKSVVIVSNSHVLLYEDLQYLLSSSSWIVNFDNTKHCVSSQFEYFVYLVFILSIC